MSYKKIYDLQARVRSSDRVLSSFDEDDDGITLLREEERKGFECNKLRIFGILFSVVIVFISGYVTRVLAENFLFPKAVHKIENINEIVDPAKIKDYHVTLTRETHLAGTRANYQLAELIRDQFTQFNFDKVEIQNYTVRLPFPDPRKPNMVRVLAHDGKMIHECKSVEDALTGFERLHPSTPLFNAWSKAGSVKRPYVYANYGTPEDFSLLNTSGVIVKDKIVLVRYGAIFRGNQAKNALDNGAAAVVFFKDLSHPEIKERFPESEWAPDTAGARGTIRVANGDQDSVGWPAHPESYKNKSSLDCGIIAQPITGRDARVLLEKLEANSKLTLPDAWRTNLMEDGVDYHVGSGSKNSVLLEVTVNVQERTVNASTVIGTIYGEYEPDRWVLLGNHRDAWTYGAIDPGSGTAALLEVGRALSHFKNLGWQPRRTIKLCSWDVEEWGLIGSLEWIEDHRKELEAKAVLYVNTDVAEGGTCESVAAFGSPLLRNLTLTLLRKDEVNKALPKDSDVFTSFEVGGSGSDYFGFYSYAGVSVVDVECDSSADVYHTAYDTQHLFDIVDKDYKHLASLTATLARIVTSVSEPVLLPLKITDMTTTIKTWWDLLHPQLSKLFSAKSIPRRWLDSLDNEIDKLQKAATKFQEYIQSKGQALTELEARIANDKFLRCERAFLVDSHILGGGFYSRNILTSTTTTDLYAASGFPSLHHILSVRDLPTNVILIELEKIKQSLNAATQILSDE